MKNLFLGLTLAAGLLTNAATAQHTAAGGPPTPAARAERLTATMTERLQLTPEQSKKVGEINLKYADEAKALKEERKGAKGGEPGAFKDLKDQKNAELKDVLTADQYTKWIAMERQTIERRKEMHHVQKADQRPDKQ
ncbi:MAG: hypothetical protein QM724_12340 [Flavobacteriales bacterium]